MNDFEGLFTSDYGFKPSSTRSAPISDSRSARPDSVFSDARSADFPSVATKPPAYDFDSVFEHRPNLEPVYDKPVYDDDGGDGIGVIGGDIFNGVPGVRSSASAAAASSSSARVKFDDVFASVSSSSPPRRGGGGGGNASAFDDLLGGFGKAEPRWKSPGAKRPEKSEKSSVDFDDLIPGFGAGSLPTERSAPDANRPPENFAKASKTTAKVVEDPFVSTGQYSDPLEEISKFSNSRSMKTDSVGNGRLFDDVDPFDGLVRPSSSFNSERENRVKETSNLRTESNTSGPKTFTTREMHENPSVRRSPDDQKERKVPVDNDWDSHQTYYDMPTAASDKHKSFGQTTSPPYGSGRFNDSNPQVDRSPPSEENVELSDDVWITVSEIPLFTQPTSAPPPSRPPPPKPVSKTSSTNARRKNNEFSSFPNPSQNFQVPNSTPAMGRSSVVSPIDELEDFARGRSQDSADEHVNGLSSEELEMNSAATAMKEAMDRAHAKIRQAKEVRERENSKSARSKEGLTERDEKLMQDERAREKQERLERQRLQREKEDEEMEQQRLEREMEMEREREEREREQRRVEKEKESAREIERERERARQAVERATREARERAAIDARQKAERLKAERSAVDKANSEARERAERAAVQRAQSEARERAAIEAKERAERVAREARERANAESAAAREREARERAAVARAEAEARARASERAAVGRAAAEARERAAVEARDRAAAAARASQQKNENDIESFFSSRASSAPRPRATSSSSDPFFDAPPQSKRDPEVPRGASGNPSNIRKASSSTNIVDDLSSIFGAAPSSGQFNDIEGESDERRRARLERHQRTQERAAKALAEKNQRDLQVQLDQAERNRIGETLDVEIKRWASGKEGNLRALLSTLQYVLWPACGWQPVSLTDMITPTSVKKVYRKATLCIHPDKVQQKGANIQQKYVAEKVFDLLKEAWNKFNSEELF